MCSRIRSPQVNRASSYLPAAVRRDWVPVQLLFEQDPLPATLVVTHFPLLFNKLLRTKAVTLPICWPVILRGAKAELNCVFH